MLARIDADHGETDFLGVNVKSSREFDSLDSGRVFQNDPSVSFAVDSEL